MNLSVQTVFDKITPQPCAVLMIAKTRKFALSHNHIPASVRIASHNAQKQSDKLRQFQENFSQSMDHFIDDVAHAKKTTVENAKHLLEHHHVTLHGSFNALIP